MSATFTKQFLLPVLALMMLTDVATAQVEGTMPFMKSLPQVTYYNPAFKPEYRFSLACRDLLSLLSFPIMDLPTTTLSQSKTIH
jgi:hypothetical protein